MVLQSDSVHRAFNSILLSRQVYIAEIEAHVKFVFSQSLVTLSLLTREIDIIERWRSWNIAAWFIEENTLLKRVLNIGRSWRLNSSVTSWMLLMPSFIACLSTSSYSFLFLLVLFPFFSVQFTEFCWSVWSLGEVLLNWQPENVPINIKENLYPEQVAWLTLLWLMIN